MSAIYDSGFYCAQECGSLDAARVVMPLVLTAFPSRSVVDVGCGLGTWLCAAQECGVGYVTGFDGDYVDRTKLYIDRDNFRAIDLASSSDLEIRADLAISLEVAEHLPPCFSESLVARLTSVAPVVLFSAAIPGQGGANHINEQWQDYWRALFRQHGYKAVDLIRPRIRGNRLVPWWYQQNAILYCSEAALALRGDIEPVADEISLNCVHQDLYELTIARNAPHLSKAIRSIPHLTVRAIGKRLGLSSSPPDKWQGGML